MAQKILVFCKVKERVITTLFFILFLLTGLAVFKDYGVSVDEMKHREEGIVSFNYVFHHDKYIFKSIDKDYGVAFQLPLVILEKVLGFKDLRDIFLMRHLLTFLTFYVGVIFFYLLCKRIFNSWKYGLIGSTFLVLSPRIFADSFYNCTDLVFLSGFIAAMYTLILFLDKKTVRCAMLHGVVSALVINIRILGILIPCFTFLSLLLDYVSLRSSSIIYSGKYKKYAVLFLIYVAVFLGFSIVFCPVLWEHPISNFIKTLKLIKYRFGWQVPVLYFGEYLPSSRLPWHYLPVWIIITTPLAYLFLCITGFFSLTKNFITSLQHCCWKVHIHQFIILMWLFVPSCAVIVLGSVMYDGFRHLFFIYPAILLIGISGLVYIVKMPWHKASPLNKLLRMSAYFFIILNLSSTLYFMIIYHPYQNVYFNVLAGLAGQSISKNFELDYWGLSYKQGLEYILTSDSRKEIKIFFLPWVGMYNLHILPNIARQKLIQVDDKSDADYLIGNFRWPSWQKDYPPADKEIFNINVDNNKILAVYRLK